MKPQHQRVLVGGLLLAAGGYCLYKTLFPGDGKKNKTPTLKPLNTSAGEEKDETVSEADKALVVEASKLFEGTFKSKATHAASAPGRVNLIGEHTDYNDGFVMPCALEYRTVVVGAFNHSDVIRIISKGQNDIFQATPSELEEIPQHGRWFCYPQGVLALYRRRGVKIPGMDIAIVGNVPLGSGLSSSAALEVATANFLENILNLHSTGAEKALIGQAAEHEFARVKCGIMDQFISSLGKEGHALLLDCRSQKPEYIPLDSPDYVILVTNTNVKHKLVDSPYEQRKASCRTAVEALKKYKPKIQALRDATLDDLKLIEEDVDKVTLARARHVIGENSRTLEFATMLRSKDYVRAGKLMVESHTSLQKDYEVSCEELDFIVDELLKQDGVVGARMTGGGFGGSTVALVRKNKVSQVQFAVQSAYQSRLGKEATFLVTSAKQGARYEEVPNE